MAARKNHYIIRRKQPNSFKFISINLIRKEWLLEASGCKWLHGKVTLFSREKTTEKFYFFDNLFRKEWRQVAASGCTERSLYFPEKKMDFFLINCKYKRDFHSRDLKEKSFKGEVSLKKRKIRFKREVFKKRSLFEPKQKPNSKEKSFKSKVPLNQRKPIQKRSPFQKRS